MTCSDIAQLDFAVKQGTDFQKIFRFLDGAGAAVDLTGYVLKFKAVKGSTTITQDLEILVTPVGDALLHLTPAQTRTVPIGRQMQYALEIREPGDMPPGSGNQTIGVEGYLAGEQGTDNDD